MGKIIARIEAFLAVSADRLREWAERVWDRVKRRADAFTLPDADAAPGDRRSVVRADNPYVHPKSRVVQKRIQRAERRRFLRQRYDNMSLKTAFAVYVAAFLLLALALIVFTDFFFNLLHAGVLRNYDDLADPGYRFYSASGSTISYYNPGTNELQYLYLSAPDAAVIDVLNALRVLSIPFFPIVSVILAGILFFRNRLEPPIGALKSASQKISEKDLGFTVRRTRGDEFGQLCDSFESMREALLHSNNEMWRQMEERRRLNGAFSHDLRTPLTVLKGNAQMLLQYMSQSAVSDAKMERSVLTMLNHVSRMETYVNAMSSLQRLEDISVVRREVDRREFSGTLKNIAGILAAGKSLHFFDDIDSDTLLIDAEVVLQAAENLLGNAARFAKSRVAVVCSRDGARLSVSVSDDGPGFSNTDLKLATNPFYKAKKNIYDTHFGLGLNISKILTERHGGGITLGNIGAGGAIVRAEFSEK